MEELLEEYSHEGTDGEGVKVVGAGAPGRGDGEAPNGALETGIDGDGPKLDRDQFVRMFVDWYSAYLSEHPDRAAAATGSCSDAIGSFLTKTLCGCFRSPATSAATTTSGMQSSSTAANLESTLRRRATLGGSRTSSRVGSFAGPSPAPGSSVNGGGGGDADMADSAMRRMAADEGVVHALSHHRDGAEGHPLAGVEGVTHLGDEHVTYDDGDGDGEPAEEEEEEDEEEPGAGMTRTEIFVKSFSLILFGVAVVTFFSDPMVDVLAAMGNRLSIKPFYVSFVVSPIVSNASELISSLVFASRRTRKTITMTYSTLMGAAIMNNTFVLGVFLALVRFRGLAWTFSAESTSIFVIQLVMVYFATRKVQSVFMGSVVVGMLFPLAIVLVAVLENAIGWD